MADCSMPAEDSDPKWHGSDSRSQAEALRHEGCSLAGAQRICVLEERSCGCQEPKKHMVQRNDSSHSQLPQQCEGDKEGTQDSVCTGKTIDTYAKTRNLQAILGAAQIPI